MSDNKYRVHEVAKDFKINGKAVGSKKVMEILTKYGETPSSHMAVLSDKELSIIFDYLTQNNQIKDLEEVFKETYHEPKSGKGESKKPAPKPAEGGWTCSCGAVNTGKFCMECGASKPADGWVCSCGAVNKGKFCANCGNPRP